MGGLRDRLALLLGVWTASTVAPPLAFVITGPFDGSVGAVDIGLLVGLFVLGTGSAKLSLQRVADPATRFRKGIEMGGAIGIAGIVLNAAFVVDYMVGLVAAIPFGVGGAVGCLAAFFIGYTADRAIIARSRAETDHRLTWSAKRRPDTGRIRIVQATAAVVALGLAVWHAIDGGFGFALLWLLFAGFQFSQDIIRKLQRRQYEIIDAGLVTTFGHLPWEDFDGYDLTDDELVLYGNVWPFGRVAYDRESVDDLDAVVDALDRYLPQFAGEHDNPSIIDNLRKEVLS